MKINELPQTDSIQELARFYDTHEFTDFEDELEEVTEPVFEREAVVSIHLPLPETETVKRLAKAKGIEFVELIREWVVEKAHTALENRR